MDVYWTKMDRFGVFSQIRWVFIVTAEMYQYSNGEDEASTRIVELSRQDLKNAARLLSLILNAPAIPPPALGSGGSVTRPTPPESANGEQLPKFARWLFEGRKARNRFFHPGLFGEAAWDVLLVLYVMDQAGPPLTIAHLSKIAGVPTATILRWLQTLESQALVTRRPHPHDRRSALVQITSRGREAMDSYLSETLAAST